MILYVIAKYCNERRWRYSLCMLRFRSPTMSFEVASSIARECHGRKECATDRRKMRRKPKKTWRKTPLSPRRKKDGKGRRRAVHYCRGLRVSRTQLNGAGWDDRRTAARRRLDNDCCGWPPAAGNTNRYAIALCPVVLRRSQARAYGCSQLFHPKTATMTTASAHTHGCF